MLSEKQFRERARGELRQIGDELLSVAGDRNIYWRVERDIIAHNPQLHNARNAFLDMLRGCYADAMTVRVLRLLSAGDGEVSLPAILARLADYPQLLQDRITEHEFADDRAALEQAAAALKRVAMPHTGRHERSLPALAAVHRELDAAIELLLPMVKTYYWIIADRHIDLEASYSGDALSIFQCAWAVPILA
ncbi:MAG TPA: hypothetical protein VL240_11115 [Candidatus Binatia bacterium]|nr:hypothetical protein [Candidatus Binatia bacterium]